MIFLSGLHPFPAILNRASNSTGKNLRGKNFFPGWFFGFAVKIWAETLPREISVCHDETCLNFVGFLQLVCSLGIFSISIGALFFLFALRSPAGTSPCSIPSHPSEIKQLAQHHPMVWLFGLVCVTFCNFSQPSKKGKITHASVFSDSWLPHRNVKYYSSKCFPWNYLFMIVTFHIFSLTSQNSDQSHFFAKVLSFRSERLESRRALGTHWVIFCIGRALALFKFPKLLEGWLLK